MAGDWIKMRLSLSREPEVRGIAKATNLDPFAVVGRLHALWSYADEISEDGTIPYTERDDLDAMLDCPGFSEALVAVGWLKVQDGAVTIPRFDRHNGRSAKSRAEATNRKRESRKPRSKGKKEACPDPVTEMSQEKCDKSVTREEKRREEKDSVVVARAREVSIPAPGAESNWTGSQVYAEIPNLIVHTVGWHRCDPKDTEAVVEGCHRIIAGDYPEIPDRSRGDPLGWLVPRLTRYWGDRKAERDAGATLNPPSLAKVMAEGKWRIDPDTATPNIARPEPKLISPERARALDRYTRSRT